jgi:glyoxylase-like metal-dependent hydrolase (beta-lactamase superfamily II)
LTRRVPYDFNKEAWINADLNKVSYFTENQVFDLGGRIVKVMDTPGHTPGSICLFVENEGLLFSGDSVEQGDIWLHCEECLPLCIYQNSIIKLLNIADEIDCVFPSHGKTPIRPKILFEINDGIEKIKSGKRKGAEIETFIGKGLSCAFDSFGIIYRDDNIYPAGKG